MTVKITKTKPDPAARTLIKVEGKLTGDDAAVLERTLAALDQTGPGCEIDLSGVSFVSNDAAVALNRLARDGAILTGMDFFIRSVFEVHSDRTNSD